MAQISCKRDIAGRTTVSGWPYEHCHKQSRHKVSVPFVWKENGFVPDSEKPTFPGVRDKIDGGKMQTPFLARRNALVTVKSILSGHYLGGIALLFQSGQRCSHEAGG